MKSIKFVAALLCGLLTFAPAHAETAPFETTFAGYPAETSQHGLRELEAGLFARENLDRETGCLAAALYFEARGEVAEGQTAVAQVIMNRVKSTVYPDTVCGVVWQNSHMRNRCQFSFTCDGQADLVREEDVWQTAKMISIGMLCERKCNYMKTTGRPAEKLDAGTQGATHYHADYVNPSWSRKLKRMAQIGRHIFYRSQRVAKTIPVTTGA